MSDERGHATSELTAEQLSTLRWLSKNEAETILESLLYGVFDLAHIDLLERGGYLERWRWQGGRVSFRATKAGRRALGIDVAPANPAPREQATTLIEAREAYAAALRQSHADEDLVPSFALSQAAAALIAAQDAALAEAARQRDAAHLLIMNTASELSRTDKSNSINAANALGAILNFIREHNDV